MHYIDCGIINTKRKHLCLSKTGINTFFQNWTYATFKINGSYIYMINLRQFDIQDDSQGICKKLWKIVGEVNLSKKWLMNNMNIGPYRTTADRKFYWKYVHSFNF